MRSLRVLRVPVHMSKGFRASPSLSRAHKVGKRSSEGEEGGKVERGWKGEVRQPSSPQPEETGTGGGCTCT